MVFLLLAILLGLPILSRGRVQFMGMNIAGFDFGCQIDGTCSISSAQPPSDGASQMQHFVNDDKMNIFRFPVSWQYLVSNNIGSTLDSTNFGKYDQLIQACLATNAYCAIDIHNFARVNGKIIGQGGPSDDQFADLWMQLASRYEANTKVIFGLMNEPHDVDINIWATTVQAAVVAIRNTGAVAQMILLPGNNFTSAGQFVPDESGDALAKVTNPDGTTAGLIMDIHKYLDIDNSGEHAECTTDNISDAFAVVAAFLRENGRQAMVSETGAGSTSSCFTYFCAQNTFLNQNSDVFLGYIAWAAGSFGTSYVLSLTPTKENGKYVDNALASQCVVAPWLSAGTEIITSPIATNSFAVSFSGLTSRAEVFITSLTTSGDTVTAASSNAMNSKTAGSSTSSLGSSGITSTATKRSGATKTTTLGQPEASGAADLPSIAGRLIACGLLAAMMA